MGRATAAVCVFVLAASVSACGGGDSDDKDSGRKSPTPTLSATLEQPSPSDTWRDDDDVLLDKGDCYTTDDVNSYVKVTEVSCDHPHATAKVLKRLKKKFSYDDPPDCPVNADHVVGVDGDSATEIDLTETFVTIKYGSDGYACTRELEPPHPSDPGGGGGIGVRKGDCLEEDTGGTDYSETECLPKGVADDQYKIIKIDDDGSGCPAGTAKKLTLGKYSAILSPYGDVYCAAKN